MLSETAVSFLSPLAYRGTAQRLFNFIPLGGIYWDDEIPDFALFSELPRADRDLILRLFSIRFELWRGKTPSHEDQRFFETARSQVPGYALFRRLTLSSEDRQAQMECERWVLEGVGELLSDADEAEIEDQGHGFTISARFDLDK
jgi:hypothetical protein